MFFTQMYTYFLLQNNKKWKNIQLAILNLPIIMIHNKRPSGNARALCNCHCCNALLMTLPLFRHITEQDVIDTSDVGTGDCSIVINITVYKVA